ncbi:MAG: glutaredoxin 3 [Gammaproteobacteria bacterium]|nr:glutaredoxin 3 [Gammaproteobacteria bacterium]
MSLPDIVMYANQSCPYCERARQVLRRRKLPFTEIDVVAEPGMRAEMMARSGRRTVPQIFIGDTHVGGSDELCELDADGRLDALLGD